MSKPTINKLGYPLWLNILFYCLTILGPIILAMIEGLQAANTTKGVFFKVTFMVLAIAIIAWTFIKKLLINKIETKLIAKQAALEHDYSIDNGDITKIKYLWYKNEVYLLIFNMLSIALCGGLLCVILVGAAEALIQVKGIIMIIASMYIVAYTLKIIYIIARKNGAY